MRMYEQIESPAPGGAGLFGLEQERGLLDVEREVVHDERRLSRRVFGADEIDLNRLSLVGDDVERLLGVTGRGVEVRVRGQRGQDRSGRVADLNLQRVERGRRGGLRGVDVQVEGQRRRR